KGSLFHYLSLLPAATEFNWSSSSAPYSATDLKKIQVLGRGDGKRVYKVRHKETSKFYALKSSKIIFDPIQITVPSSTARWRSSVDLSPTTSYFHPSPPNSTGHLPLRLTQLPILGRFKFSEGEMAKQFTKSAIRKPQKSIL
ncbi:hypothetical protein G4B88_007723, partial [Cannabis sativa]